MQLFCNVLLIYHFKLVFLLSCLINSSSGRRFNGFYPEGNYYQLADKIKTALGKLKQEPHLVPNWPDASVKMGQVSGVALDHSGNVLVFHRASEVWDGSTFNNREVYQNIGQPPIPHATVLVFNETGNLIDMWGQNLFYLPHGITVGLSGDVFITDVAMHQVFKFTAQNRKEPALVLGEKFVPGNDDQHFCKPAGVAVLSTGDFFVADGYCNTRIIKYAADGTMILQWGRRSGHSPFVFNVVHALTLAEDRGLVCAADRERGRAACFRSDNGTYVTSFQSWLIGPRLFSLAYAPVNGGRLYVVNGPPMSGEIPVRGYVIDFTSGKLIQTFAPEGDFSNPHDIVTTPDGSKVYVVEIQPYKVYKFVEEGLKSANREGKNITAPVKPTATIEVTNAVQSMGAGAPEGVWWGAAGGAAGAAGAALLLLAALALVRARKLGRKSLPRRRWEYGGGEFQLRRLLERGARGVRGARGGFTRVQSDDSEDEPAPMLPPQPPANA